MGTQVQGSSMSKTGDLDWNSDHTGWQVLPVAGFLLVPPPSQLLCFLHLLHRTGRTKCLAHNKDLRDVT